MHQQRLACRSGLRQPERAIEGRALDQPLQPAALTEAAVAEGLVGLGPAVGHRHRRQRGAGRVQPVARPLRGLGLQFVEQLGLELLVAMPTTAVFQVLN